jgi:hypothetical protein
MVRFSAVAAALALAPLLAGCISQSLEPQGLLDDVLPPGALPAATLRCPPGLESCNLLTTLEPERQGNEVTIAVNPTDPRNVVAGAKDYYPPSAGQCVWNGVYHTTDGQAFQSRSLPGSPWLLTTDPGSFEPNAMSQYWCATDPVVAFALDGTLHYTLLAYQGDPITASKLGKDQTCALPGQPAGCTGVNDVAFNRVSIIDAISRDGGATFEQFSIIDSGSFPVNFHDRQWVEVDQRNGNVYVAWTSFFLGGNLLYRSTDGGMSWSLPTFLNEVPTALHGPGGMFVATGQGGEVLVSGCGAEGPMLTVSTDEGATFGGWHPFGEGADEGMEAEYRSGQVCMVAADDTDGPHGGNVYMVWSSTKDGNRDIWFQAAPMGYVLECAGGALCSAAHDAEPVAIKLNDDATANDQFFPAISVAPNGIIDVVWYDRRDDPENRLLDIYHTYSLDGGKTWAPNLRVTEVSSDPVHSLHQGGFVFIGDYIDLDSSAECAWPAWVDTRFGKADVMTACVERPGARSA